MPVLVYSYKQLREAMTNEHYVEYTGKIGQTKYKEQHVDHLSSLYFQIPSGSFSMLNLLRMWSH